MAGHVVSTGNRLLSDGTYNYTYDAEGNRTSRTQIATGEKLEYAWDYRNRLTLVTYKDGSNVVTKQVAYEYDAFDRRVRKQVDETGNGTWDRGEQYVYDDDHIALVFDDSGNLLRRNLHGEAIDQIFASEFVDTGETNWYLTDHLGTVRDVYGYDDVLNDIASEGHITYDSFGNILAGAAAAEQAGFTYTGREWDADAQLYYYRKRWYDAATGQFVSQDPIGFAAGDGNLRRYVENQPAGTIDPNGLKKVSVTFKDRAWFAANDPKYQHRWYKSTMDDWHFGVSGMEEVLGILGIDADSATISQETISVYGEELPYVLVKGKNSKGKCVEYYGAYEGVYNGKELIGFSFYSTEAELAYNLTALDKLKAMQSLVTVYGVGVGSASSQALNAARATQKARFSVAAPTRIVNGGTVRAAKFGANWQSASLQKAIGDHAGSNYTTWKTDMGKVIYENPSTGRQVVYDVAGNYFRIFQPNKIGGAKGKYLNLIGKEVRPAMRTKNGVECINLESIDKGRWQIETHFKASDPNPSAWK